MKLVENSSKEVLDTRELLSKDKVTFKTLIDKSYNIDDNCIDSIVQSSNMYFYVDEELNRISNKRGLFDSRISSHAFSQLCGKIGVPVGYIAKCLKNREVDLAMDNVNTWLQNFDSKLFVRFYKDNIRGVLSPKYSCFDSHEILESVEQVIPMDDYTIKGYLLNEERLHIRLVSKNQMPIGEDLFHGITIDSSDVGRSSLNINFFIYKQVCSNGLIVPKKFGSLYNQRHIGIKPENIKDNVKESLDLIEPLIAKVIGCIQDRSSITLSNYFNEVEDINNLISDVKKWTELSKEGSEKVVELLRNGTYPRNQWGLINSITHIAQDYTLEKRLQLERIAGNMLIA